MSNETALEKALALVQTLHARTRDGRLDWRETGDEQTFETELADFRLRIKLTQDRDYPDEPDYKLIVFKKDSGREIERISNVTLRPVMDRTTADGLNPYALLGETHEMARRQALRVDDALERILETLKEE